MEKYLFLNPKQAGGGGRLAPPFVFFSLELSFLTLSP